MMDLLTNFQLKTTKMEKPHQIQICLMGTEKQGTAIVTLIGDLTDHHATVTVRKERTGITGVTSCQELGTTALPHMVSITKDFPVLNPVVTRDISTNGAGIKVAVGGTALRLPTYV